MRRYLHVDMDARTCRFEPLPKPLASLGGRALASFLSVQAPLSLSFAPGLLAGCRGISAGRCSVCCSSLEGSVLHSNAGGAFGYALTAVDLAAVLITGGTLPAEPSVLLIGPDLARLEPFPYPCLTVSDSMREMAARWPDASALVTAGPAAWHGLSMASLEFSDHHLKPGGHAGGGTGAVLFRKGLRGIVILGGKTEPSAVDPDGLKAATQHFVSALKDLRDSISVSKGGCSPHCSLACHHRKNSGENPNGKGGKFKWPGFAEYWSTGDPAVDAENVRRFSFLCDELGADSFILARLMMQMADQGLLERGKPADALCELQKLSHAPETSLLYTSAAACTEKKGRKAVNDDTQDVVMDCLGICRFAAEAMLRKSETRDAVWDMASSLHGLIPGDVDEMAVAVLAIERGPKSLRTRREDQ